MSSKDEQEQIKVTLLDARQYIMNEFTEVIENLPDEVYQSIPEDQRETIERLIALTRDKWQVQLHTYRATLGQKRPRRTDQPENDIRRAFRLIQGTDLVFYRRGKEYFIYRGSTFLTRVSTTSRLLLVLRRHKRNIDHMRQEKQYNQEVKLTEEEFKDE